MDYYYYYRVLIVSSTTIRVIVIYNYHKWINIDGFLLVFLVLLLIPSPVHTKHPLNETMVDVGNFHIPLGP